MNLTDYDVIGPEGFRICSLNKKLAKKQGVSKEQLEALKLSHQLRFLLFETAKTTTEPLKLKMLANLLEILEFRQQELWNFPIDKNYHHWFELPNCICPKLDNLDRLGTKFRIYDYKCPVHGVSQ